MNRDEKAAVIDEIAAQIEESEAIFAVDYRGISVPEAAELRSRLREADATFRIVKNSLTDRAADKAGAETLRGLLDGPTALTFVRGDAAVAAKALSDVGKATDSLSFKGGLLGSEALDSEQIKSIARLPSRDTLHGQLVGLVASPLSGLAAAMGNLLGGLARQLGLIAEQGLVEGEAPAAEEAPAETAEEPAAEAPQADTDNEEADAPADATDEDAAEAKEDA